MQKMGEAVYYCSLTEAPFLIYVLGIKFYDFEQLCLLGPGVDGTGFVILFSRETRVFESRRRLKSDI